MTNFCIRQRGSPGYMVVTLLIFSGLEDPQWGVDRSVFNESDHELLQSVSYKPECAPPRLGYRGFRVKFEGKKPILVVGNDTESVRLQYKLLETMPNCTISSHFRHRVWDEIGKIFAQCPGAEHYRSVFLDYLNVYRNYPDPSNLDTWNKNPRIKENNNCYNYAVGKITNLYAQPGKGSWKRPLKSYEITGKAVKEAAKCDGLLPLPDPQPGPGDPIPVIPDPETQHLVALFIDEGNDFHWYRLDQNGQWSHKPGETCAVLHDNKLKGGGIKDPRDEKTDTGNYKFACYMIVDKEKANIK